MFNWLGMGYENAFIFINIFSYIKYIILISYTFIGQN
jgi:hypothetical protein